MEPLLFISAFVLLLFNFVYKTYLKPRIIDEDTFQLLRCAREIRRAGKIPYLLHYNLFDAKSGKKFDYPPLFPWLLSWFTPEFLLKHFHYVTPVTDTVAVISIISLIYFYLGDGYAALFTLIIHMTVPSIYLESFHVTGRILSVGLFCMFLMPLVLFNGTIDVSLLLLSSFAGGLLLLEHCLGVQALIVVIIGLSVYEGRPIYIVAFLLSVLFAAGLSKGHSLYVHRGHLNKLSFDRKTVHSRGIDQLELVRKFTPRLRQMSHVSPGKIQAFAKLVTMEPMPYLWFILVGIWLSNSNIFHEVINVRLMVWLAALVGAYILTEFVKPLRFLGHGKRYLHYSVVPVGILASRILIPLSGLSFVSVKGAIFWITVLVCIVINGYYALRYQSARGKSYNEQDLYMAAAFLGHLPGDNVAVFPYSFAAYVGFVSDKSILMKFASDGCHASHRYFPLVKDPLKEFVLSYGIKYIFVDSDYVSFRELDVQGALLVKKIGKFELYEVNSHEKLSSELPDSIPRVVPA